MRRQARDACAANATRNHLRSAGARGAQPALPVLLLLVLMLVACAGVPSEDLRSYSDAYDKARASGTLIYEGFLPTAMANQPANTPDGNAGATSADPAPPPSLAGKSYLADALGPRSWVRATGTCDEFAAARDVMARCQALAAIAEYDKVLLLLDSGEGAQALQGRLQTILGFADSLTTLAAITPAAPFLATSKPLLGALSAIVGQALSIRDRQMLRAKLNEGAPTVAKLIALLRQDVGAIYIAQWDQYAVQLAERDRAISENARIALRAAFAHQPPQGPELIAARADLAERYEAALASVGTRPPDLARIEDTFAESGGTPFTLTTVAEISKGVKGVESSTAQFAAIRRNWRDYVDALKAYDAMLASVQSSLTALVEHSNDPLAPGGGTAQLIESATAIRDQAREIERLVGPHQSRGAS